jgi:ABC-type multidrug transport system ATPase subunit
VLVIEDLQRPGFGPFTLSVGPGGCCVVAGPSGAGKSVLLRMVADLDPNRGRVALDDRLREDMPAPAWRRLVAYLPAESGWWADGVREHFPSTEGAERLLEAVRLPGGALDWPVVRLSTGERQRLALVRALLQEPRVLLLDEPTSALDPAATEAVEALLRERLDAGAILLLVSHDAAQGERLGSQSLRIEAGRPVAQG